MSDEVPIEAFVRTPEQKAADEARHKAELERERLKDVARGGEPFVAPRKRVDNGESLEQTLERIRGRAEEFDAERKALPCYAGTEANDEDAAVDACEAVEGWKACRWVSTVESCPRAQSIATYESILENLSAPPKDLRVPEREAAVIAAAARRKERVPLWKLDTLQVVRSLLTRRRVCVDLENGAEVRKNEREPTKPERLAGKAYLVGNEVLAVLAGNQGRGKTLAVCYAIARMGGVYTRAAQWTRRNGIDIDQAIAAPVLAIDQFGREHFGDSRWALSQFEDVIDTRQQSLSKWTFLAGNLTYETFVERLKETTVADRLGFGVFVEFGGPSVRAGMRAAALKGQP